MTLRPIVRGGRPQMRLPLREAPIRFCATRTKNTGVQASYSWKLRVEQSEEAYLFLRDGLQDENFKVSFHKSGQIHIKPPMMHLTGTRQPTWRKGHQEGLVRRSLVLPFPSWGFWLPEAVEPTRLQTKNDLFVEVEDDELVVVSLSLLDLGDDWEGIGVGVDARLVAEIPLADTGKRIVMLVERARKGEGAPEYIEHGLGLVPVAELALLHRIIGRPTGVMVANEYDSDSMMLVCVWATAMIENGEPRYFLSDSQGKRLLSSPGPRSSRSNLPELG